MKTLEFSVKSAGPAEILQIEGEVDVYNSFEVKSAVDELLEAGKVQLAIDLSRVAYIDSSGLGALITAQSRIEKAGGTLTLISPSEQIKSVLALTKMGSFFRIAASSAEIA